MSNFHGIYVEQTDTVMPSTTAVTCGIPFVVGTAPIQSAESPVAVNTPTLCTTWSQAVAVFGYSDDWANYTLCEFMYSHFNLYCCQPVIFCNVLDPSTMKEAVTASDMAVVSNQVTLPIDAIYDATLVVKATSSAETAYVDGTDYTAYYSDEALIVELLSSGSAYEATSLNIAYTAISTASITDAIIALGLNTVDLCMSTVGVIPDLICAPGYSGSDAVAAVMAAKGNSINGLFVAKALIDVEGDDQDEAIAQKASDNMVDSAQIICWPMATKDGKTYHMSTLLAGLIAQVDSGNSDCPYESPSNKTIQCDGLVLADGTDLVQTFQQANQLNAGGIVTALNWLGDWVCWGNYTAAYPDSIDPKDITISISRMFGYVGYTLIDTIRPYLDKPLIRRIIDVVVDTVNIMINGWIGAGYLLGGRVEYLADDNTTATLMAGQITFNIALCPPGPMQVINFKTTYDLSYLSSLVA